jgi:hypothetical protein
MWDGGVIITHEIGFAKSMGDMTGDGVIITHEIGFAKSMGVGCCTKRT